MKKFLLPTLVCATSLSVFSLPVFAETAGVTNVAARASSNTISCSDRKYLGPITLTKCMTVENVVGHMQEFQDIADANGGTRASGLPGYDESAFYVAQKAEEAGYDVTLQEFSFTLFTNLGSSTFAQIAPTPTTYVEGETFQLMSQTEPGTVEGPVAAVDLDLGLGNTSTSGCDVEDFADFPAGSIALIQRGLCNFSIKVENAAAAGATAAIIFNQGNTEDPIRTDLFIGNLGGEYSGGIPAFAVSYALGEEFANTEGLELSLFSDALRETTTTLNVLADSPSGDPNSVVMVGAHLDSVDEGPGIQDNGSGSAAILETALQMASAETRNKVRFAWWGAEESGLVGSTFYVNDLSDEEFEQIALYLNFDMVASPNYVRFIYDGDGSAFGLAGPEGSANIESYYERFYSSRGFEFQPTEISFRSDYAAFFNTGIPFGGLFTGAEGIKTEEEAAIYGGTAGDQYDPCYHLICDTIRNRNDDILDLNADAIAASTLYYAKTWRGPPAVAATTTARSLQAARAGAMQTQSDYYGKHLVR